MATFVIVGLNAQGLSNFGARNVQESQKEATVAQYEAAGWTHVEAVRETF